MSGVLRKVQRPLIIGHYGGCNTGDEAMLAGILEAIGSSARQQATVVVKEGSLEENYRNLGVSPARASLSSVLSALLRADGLVLGGGTHFHDDYTTLRYLRHFRYMSRFVVLSILAKLLGRKVTWLGMGFGPFYRRPTRWLTRLGLAFCDRVTVRDAISHQEVADWVPSQKLALAFDLAALLACNSHGTGIRIRKQSLGWTTLGVSVTSLRNSMSGGPEADSALWNRLAAALIGTLSTNPSVRVRILVIRGGEREADWELSRKLHSAISSVHPGRSEIVPYHPDPTTTLRRIAECDAFIATRYHAGVLAYLAGCPLLLIAYHRKVRDLAKEIGLSSEACLDVAEEIDGNLLVDRVSRMMEGDNAFRARLPVSQAAQRAWLNIRALEAVLPGLGADSSAVRLDRAPQPRQPQELNVGG